MTSTREEAISFSMSMPSQALSISLSLYGFRCLEKGSLVQADASNFMAYYRKLTTAATTAVK
jgi:hypothetical protein